MVNFRRIIYDIVLALLVAPAFAAPRHDSNCKHDDHLVKHYDQSQNGTENYRLNIDGFVVAVAPPETVLEAVSDMQWEQFLELHDIDNADLVLRPSLASPAASTTVAAVKPLSAEKKPSGKPDTAESTSPGKQLDNKQHNKKKVMKSRLANFLVPLLRKYRTNLE